MAVTNNIDDVSVYSSLVIANNRNALISELNKHGYAIPKGVSNEQLQSIVLTIYDKHTPEFFEILKSIPYNPGANNFTTDPSFRSVLVNYISTASPKQKLIYARDTSDTSSVLNSIGDFLGGSTQTDKTTTITTPQSGASTIWIGIGFTAAVIVLIWLYTKYS